MDIKGKREDIPPNNIETINQKIERFLGKDFSKEVLNPIVKHYSGIIKYQIGKKIGFNNPDVEDLQQKVWIKVLNYIKRKRKGFIIDCEQEKYLKRLMAKTAHDVSYDYLRKKKEVTSNL